MLKIAVYGLSLIHIFSIVIGIILFLFQLRLPQFIENPLEMIASMNTPLGMIVAGANLAQGNILKSLKNKRLYYLSFIKLIVYPLAGLVVLWLLPLEFEVAFTVFIACLLYTSSTRKTLFCIKSTAARRHPNCIIRASTR